MATGTVKCFSGEKGFGFITPDEAGKHLVVHHSDVGGEGFGSLAEARAFPTTAGQATRDLTLPTSERFGW